MKRSTSGRSLILRRQWRCRAGLARALSALCMAVVLTMSIAASAAPDEQPPMAKTIALIGAGNMGQALGNLWAAAGYHVLFASRHPDELDDVVAAAGHGAEAAAVGNAIDRAAIVVLAVPYRAEPPIAQQYGQRIQGKILVNVDNAFPHRDGEVAAKAEQVGEAVYSARLFEGTRFIRAFNLKGAASFPDPAEKDAADFEVPYTTNDESVRSIAEALIRATGGTPKYEGALENAREY